MNFNTNFPSKFGKRSFFRQIITLLCLLILLAAGWQWLDRRQNNDLSFLLPIYQGGEEIRPSAIISEDGQVLLPVRAIAENNGWLYQQCDQLKTKNQEKEGSMSPQNSCGAILLLCTKCAEPSAPEAADDNKPQAATISWLSVGGQPASLGVWLTNQTSGQLLNLSAPGRFYQNELYLPEDFFTAAFGLSLKLDEQGRANLLRPEEQA